MERKFYNIIVCGLLSIALVFSGTFYAFGAEDGAGEIAANEVVPSETDPIKDDLSEIVSNETNAASPDVSPVTPEMSETEAIDALTAEPVRGAAYDGYIVSVDENATDDIDEKAMNRIAETVIDDTTAVLESPEDALSFAAPEDIVRIEPNYKLKAFAFPQDDPIDPIYINPSNYQWGLKYVDTRAAWLQGYQGQGVTVAVLDTGVNYGHEDMNPAKIIEIQNFATGSPSTGYDDNGHGAFIASVIAADTNNLNPETGEGVGMAGIADKVNLISYKVLDANGDGSLSDMIKALNAIANNPLPIDVANLSFGHPGVSKLELDAINRVLAKGTIIIAAVGNDGTALGSNKNQVMYPANYTGVIGVGSSNSAGAVSDFSTKNNSVDVVAPGENMAGFSNVTQSGVGAYLGGGAGTSFAAPVVAAAAAIAKQRNRAIDSTIFLSALKKTAIDGGPAGYDTSYGYGILHIGRLLDYLAVSPTTILFNANSGKKVSTALQIWQGAAFGTLPKTTRKGYAFLGWYTQKSGGEKVEGTTICEALGALMLYAHWEKKDFKLTFNVNKGKHLAKSKRSKTVTTGKKYGKLPTPKRSNYKFKGWYTKKSGGKRVKSSTLVKLKKNQTLYAHWKRK